MAASTQDRLKLKQVQVDTWSTREQLCLASAVMRSGDQNWVAVRRNIKILTNETGRPPDWYSTKNCALQYARLLERVDTPKRKRERGDGGNETSGEIVTKMLSKQRIEELKALEAEERSSYNQLKKEIQQLEAGKLDHQLDTFWIQLIKEQAEEEEKEHQQQQWLKEREKITAIQQALKHQGPKLPPPPHKKKPRLQVGGGVGVAESRRSSGLSETSSEVESAAESPDLNEVTSENLSQDESVALENVTKPVHTSPLLSSLLNKSPLTGVPGAASSPLSPLGMGSRPARNLGISPVSEALQNLVTSAISGTNTFTKDKHSHTTSGGGSSTLSLLLDLPPSTPGGPLPRLSDLPGPSHDPKEQLTDALNKSENMEERCSDDKSCDDHQVVKEETGPSSGPKSLTKNTETDAKTEEDCAENKKIPLAAHSSSDEKERKEHEGQAHRKLKEGKGNEQKGEQECKHTDEKCTEKDKEAQKKVPAEIQAVADKEKTTSTVLNPAKEAEEGKESGDAVTKDCKVKAEEGNLGEYENITKKSDSGKEDDSLSLTKSCKTTTSAVETSQEGCSSSCTSEKKSCKPETKYEEAANQDKEEKERKKEQEGEERQANQEEGNDGDDEQDEDDEDEGETKQGMGATPTVTAAPIDNKAEEKQEKERETSSVVKSGLSKEGKVEGKKDEQEEEEEDEEEEDEEEEEGESKCKVTGKEREATSIMMKTEDSAANQDRTTGGKKEQELDHDGQDSKDWVSEEEGSLIGGGKRKFSVGDLICTGSPFISYSSPNSPASTHYGDDSESEKAYRSWKKPIMILWNEIAAHKFASIFLRPITDDQAPGYHSVVFRSMDLQKIKKNIESGVTRTTAEFQRDIMLMFQNAIMYNTHDHNVYQMAHSMMKDAISTIQDFLTTQMLVRAEETPQKSLRRETRESSAKRSDDDSKRKREMFDEKSLKKRRIN